VADAGRLDEDTLVHRRPVLGDDHPHTLTSANNLAYDLRGVGEHEQADRLEQDIARWRQLFLTGQRSHPD
jgi:hypothetical protein